MNSFVVDDRSITELGCGWGVELIEVSIISSLVKLQSTCQRNIKILLVLCQEWTFIFNQIENLEDHFIVSSLVFSNVFASNSLLICLTLPQ